MIARPKARFAAGLLILLLLLPLKAMAADAPQGLTRGINIRNYLAYPDSDQWPFYRGDLANPSELELLRFKRMGFDFVRLTVEVGPWISAGPAVRKELRGRLSDFVRRAGAAGLRTLVNPFPRPDTNTWRPEDILMSKDGDAFAAYRQLLRELASQLATFSGEAPVLGLMNEPQADCRRTDGPDWSELQLILYRDIRAIAPELTIVLTGGCWSRIAGLTPVDMTDFDSNTLVDVHYYEPFPFTHQGAWWTVPELHHAAGLAFPPARTDLARVEAAVARMLDARHRGSPTERRRLRNATLRKARQYARDNFDETAIRAEMAELRAWADRQGVPPGRILIGEFGVLRPWPESGMGDDGSRARWLRTVRKAASEQGFGWALWSYEGLFGLISDEATKSLDSAMIEALGLSPPTP